MMAKLVYSDFGDHKPKIQQRYLGALTLQDVVLITDWGNPVTSTCVAASLGQILTICHLGVMTPLGCRNFVKTRRWQGPTTGGENPQAVTLSSFENPC